MTTEQKVQEEKRGKSQSAPHGAADAVYGLGMIGAWVYYISHAATFWVGALGVLKGIVWPAIMVYELLRFLNL